MTHHKTKKTREILQLGETGVKLTSFPFFAHFLLILNHCQGRLHNSKVKSMSYQLRSVSDSQCK